MPNTEHYSSINTNYRRLGCNAKHAFKNRCNYVASYFDYNEKWLLTHLNPSIQVLCRLSILFFFFTKFTEQVNRPFPPTLTTLPGRPPPPYTNYNKPRFSELVHRKPTSCVYSTSFKLVTEFYSSQGSAMFMIKNDDLFVSFHYELNMDVLQSHTTG